MYTRKQATAGGQAAEKFAEALSKSGAVLETPLYPFKAGCIRFANLTGKDVGKYGAYHFDKSDKDILEKTVGLKFALAELGAFLVKECNVWLSDLRSYSWPDIIAALSRSGGEIESENLTGGAAGDTKDTMSKSARALAVLQDHPDWTNRQIAEVAGIHPKSLSRMNSFRKAREILKTSKSDIPKGSKDGETGGIEAWEK